MKKTTFLVIAIITFAMSACNQEAKTKEAQNSSIVKKDSLTKVHNEWHTKWYTDSIEMNISDKVDSMFAEQADALVPEAYEIGSVIGSIRFEEYARLARLRELGNWNSSLSKSDSENELKLTKLYESSEFSFSRYYKMQHLWQIIDYDNHDDEDIYAKVEIVAKRNEMNAFLKSYTDKFVKTKLINSANVPLSSKNSDLPAWRKLRAQAIAQYEILKQETLKNDLKLDQGSFEKQEWGRDKWRRANGM
jgi:hypothetical protein